MKTILGLCFFIVVVLSDQVACAWCISNCQGEVKQTSNGLVYQVTPTITNQSGEYALLQLKLQVTDSQSQTTEVIKHLELPALAYNA